MIYRILILYCFLGISAKGASIHQSLSKSFEEGLHSIHAFCEGDFSSSFQEDSLRTMDSLKGRNSSLNKLSLILAVSPWSMLYVPGCLEGNLSWKVRQVSYFAELSFAPIVNYFLSSRSLGLGVGFHSLSNKSILSISMGMANRRTVGFPRNGGYFRNSYFFYGRIDFKIPVFFKRVIFASGFTFSSFLFDPYFNSIYNDENWGWNMAEAANLYYRSQKIILCPNISIGYRFY